MVLLIPEEEWPAALEAAEDDLERVHEGLQALLRDQGHGSITAILDVLELSEGYLRRQRSLKRLELGKLLKILKLIDMPLETFGTYLAARKSNAGSRFLERAKRLPATTEVLEAERRFAAGLRGD